MRQFAATHRGNKSPRLHCYCDKAAYAHFVAAICCTNSNWFEFVRQIAATKFCRGDNDFHMSHEAICCSNLSRPCVAAICRIVCLGLKDCKRLKLTKCYQSVMSVFIFDASDIL